jgi:hypothetical protein
LLAVLPIFFFLRGCSLASKAFLRVELGITIQSL